MSTYAIGVRNPDGTFSDISSTNPLPISGTTTTTGGATAANQSTELTRLGDVTETSPASDTASSGLNGRLQRIAQNISSLITLITSRIPGPASTGSITPVASSATAVTLKAANTSRKSITIANDSTAILYVLLGTGTVSSTNYSMALAAKSSVASVMTVDNYTGIITGIWASVNGNAMVTELT